MLVAEEAESTIAFAFARIKCSINSSFERVERRRFSSASGSMYLVLSIFSRIANMGGEVMMGLYQGSLKG